MSQTKRITGSGLAHNGYCNLSGVTINKSDAGDTVVRLKNSLDNSGEILWEFWGKDKSCFSKNFHATLLFNIGIYVDITGVVYSVIIEHD